MHPSYVGDSNSRGSACTNAAIDVEIPESHEIRISTNCKVLRPREFPPGSVAQKNDYAVAAAEAIDIADDKICLFASVEVPCREAAEIATDAEIDCRGKGQ